MHAGLLSFGGAILILLHMWKYTDGCRVEGGGWWTLLHDTQQIGESYNGTHTHINACTLTRMYGTNSLSLVNACALVHVGTHTNTHATAHTRTHAHTDAQTHTHQSKRLSFLFHFSREDCIF